ncbi:LPS assembly lipoprotein LptE [Pseudomonas sp. NPDC089406]|uniref:LPS-assembly lipoprotein LptE n=1 Tax=Pseudomonas sp. NPDC089406 TaxID=3364463 RepID=UPI00384E45B6
MIKRNLLVMGLAVLLSACGFQLRGTGDNEISIPEINLTARNAYGELVTQLRRTLENSGVKVHSGAPYTLVLANEQDDQRAATYARASRSAEYELSTTLEYVIKGHNDTVLLQDQMEIRRYYVRDGNNVTAGSQESEQIRREMRRDLAQSMIIRLQQLTPAQLEELQAKADERAKAEARAQEEAQRIQDETPQQSPLEIPAQ